ncbi:SDR family NAD(P)-dependent oxidoreductase [Streptomyces iranensis]|uniref:3-oxoacyl-(Acyl-carrier-protein) reductase n=1 Tax=Streptomyces iranensis TaxID=576784 RepID=A0A060ZLK2_9ACTN|nr:SDR family NAD(P)-dependent oxidoreductase [Streptomyces iranensis]MBP2066334.1 3-oxoacyl-[acyl-carrier protein] reductase [Streptomyces iranensis]CDR02877.1 3-oxoacyl-(acyl-carrier-protein) reductase [Streptomyces iranensis]
MTEETRRVALVTGAARGLGECIARRLHGQGYRVALTDLDEEGAVQAAADLDPEGRATVGLALDVREKSAFGAVREQLVDRWGAVHVLVNNAALTKAESVMDISPESFDRVVSTNLNGAFFGCQVFGGYFAERGYGRIVNIASVAGQNGGTGTGAHYAAAKGGVATLTKVFARELAPHGVTVNAISPGPLDLPVVRDIISPDKIDAFERAIPVGRLGRPEFIADMAVLLAADHADAVTGACWDANGGLYMR